MTETRCCLPPESFQRVLHRERLRSDRNGVVFALLVISPRANRLAAFHALELSLTSRLRGTDVAGYMNDEQLAVLLTNTDQDGANVMAAAMRSGCDTRGDFDVSVYVYPTLPAEATPVTDALPHACATRDDGTSNTRDSANGNDSSPRPRPAQSLFTHPLPTWKRTVDVVVACVGLIMLASLFAIVAAAIKLTSRGPVFFQQRRTGQGGVPFVIYKFRTMCVNAEARKGELLSLNEQDGPAFKVKEDPRITRVGGYLRRTCLDELPQLWNVLCGDMTLVGPRPLPCDEARQCDLWQQRRLDMVPGLTCFWQVDGARDDFAEWMRMDLRYAGCARFWVDIKLLWRTFLKVVLHRASW